MRFVDSFYKLSPERKMNWKEAAKLAEDLKRVAQKHRVKIVTMVAPPVTSQEK